MTQWERRPAGERDGAGIQADSADRNDRSASAVATNRTTPTGVVAPAGALTETLPNQGSRPTMDSSSAHPRAHDLADDVAGYLAGLRRRRDAAGRLVPLADGTRDPWMSA